eukprot:3912391-Lingulodinium_polyedra.AAC.1
MASRSASPRIRWCTSAGPTSTSTRAKRPSGIGGASSRQPMARGPRPPRRPGPLGTAAARHPGTRCASRVR